MTEREREQLFSVVHTRLQSATVRYESARAALSRASDDVVFAASELASVQNRLQRGRYASEERMIASSPGYRIRLQSLLESVEQCHRDAIQRQEIALEQERKCMAILVSLRKRISQLKEFNLLERRRSHRRETSKLETRALEVHVMKSWAVMSDGGATT